MQPSRGRRRSRAVRWCLNVLACLMRESATGIGLGATQSQTRQSAAQSGRQGAWLQAVHPQPGALHTPSLP